MFQRGSSIFYCFVNKKVKSCLLVDRLTPPPSVSGHVRYIFYFFPDLMDSVCEIGAATSAAMDGKVSIHIATQKYTFCKYNFFLNGSTTKVRNPPPPPQNLVVYIFLFCFLFKVFLFMQKNTFFLLLMEKSRSPKIGKKTNKCSIPFHPF